MRPLKLIAALILVAGSGIAFAQALPGDYSAPGDIIGTYASTGNAPNGDAFGQYAGRVVWRPAMWRNGLRNQTRWLACGFGGALR